MYTNLQDPRLFATGHPFEVYAYLREYDPVHWQEEPDGGPGYWALMKYADIKQVEMDSETFSNEPHVFIGDNASIGDETHRSLIFSDPPRHTAHRALLGKELSVSRMRRAREGMEQLVDAIIDDVIESGEADLVEDLAAKMASFTIADLMGIDRYESLEMFEAAAYLTRNVPFDHGPGLDAAMTIFRHAAKAWEERKGEARDDTLGRIARAKIMGVPVDDVQFQIDYSLLVSAGSDTSRNVVGTGMMTLMEHPDARQQLIADPSLLPRALEEILRYIPPIRAMRRTATRDTELSGTKIKKGDKVVMYYGAANRDPEVFQNPDTFDIHRKVNPHLTFGGGIHHCLGSHLARLSLTAMFSAMLRRMPDMEPAGPVVWPEFGEAPMVSGPEGLRVRFTPGERAIKKAVPPIFA
jgi:cytochrome P450